MSAQSPDFWEGQKLHFVCLLTLLALVAVVWNWLAQPTPLLFWLAIATPICHQIFVLITWRLELRSKAVSRTIGFRGYLTGFFVLFAARFITIALLAWFDRDSLQLNSILQVIGVLILGIPGLYAMYSVQRYFGMTRAAGADHFEDRYRYMSLVDSGIFRFTNNGMYIYAFFLFWAIAISLNSASALLVAAFSHVYIWVHYFATEKPDMNYLYSSRG